MDADHGALPDREGMSIVCQGSVIRTSFEGEELGTESFECQLPAPCTGGDIKARICESCKITEADFQDVGFEISAKPLVKRGGLTVKSSADGLKVIYEYFQGCCGNVVEVEFVQRDDHTLQIPVTVTTRAKPAALPEGTKVYAALSVSAEDIRNDFKHSETWRVEVLRVNSTAQQFQLSSSKVGKTHRGTPEPDAPALKGAGEAVLEAVSSSNVSKAGACVVETTGVVLHGARMQSGKLVDATLSSCEASGCLAESEECHYPRGAEGPQRWTKVWCYVGEEGGAAFGESLKQPWKVYKQASPYCDGVCVPASASSLFVCEPAWSWGEPETVS
jgi:hypothetical protein